MRVIGVFGLVAAAATVPGCDNNVGEGRGPLESIVAEGDAAVVGRGEFTTPSAPPDQSCFGYCGDPGSAPPPEADAPPPPIGSSDHGDPYASNVPDEGEAPEGSGADPYATSDADAGTSADTDEDDAPEGSGSDPYAPR